MQSSSFRRAAAYLVVALSGILLAYSAWLVGVIALTLIGASPSELSEVGNGFVVLVYAALPLTVVFASVAYILSGQHGRNLGRVLTGVCVVVALIQLIWLVGLTSRGVGPLPLAVLTTALVAAAAVVNLRVARASIGRAR